GPLRRSLKGARAVAAAPTYTTTRDTTYWRLDGLHYDGLHTDSARAERLTWLANQEPEQFSLQPYDHLEKVLKAAGSSTRAQAVAITRQNAKRTLTIRRCLKHTNEVDDDWENAVSVDLATKSWLTVGYVSIVSCLMVYGISNFICYLFQAYWEHREHAKVYLWSPDGIGEWVFASLAISITALSILSWIKRIDLCSISLLLDKQAYQSLRHGWRVWLPFTGPAGDGSRVLWLYLLEGATGHGHRLGRLAALSIGWVLFTAIFFHQMHNADMFVRTQAVSLVGYTAPETVVSPPSEFKLSPAAAPEKPGADGYPKFNAYLYSIDLFVPFLEIHQDAYWTLGGKAETWMKALKIIHIIFGWAALLLVASSPFQIFRKE
ncbi:MAG: hypothetical protein ACKO1J_02020, partial [Tagaea sp.]